MKRMMLIAALAASPAVAQEQEGQTQNRQLPSETACDAVRERVQISLAQADRALQSEDHDGVARWSAIAANYGDVYAAFCPAPQSE